MRKVLTLVTLALVVTLAACAENDESTLVVGLECNYAPFNWTSTSEGVNIAQGAGYCDGYDVEVAQTIAEELGRELVIRKIDWDGLIPALTTNEIDVAVNAYILINHVDFFTFGDTIYWAFLNTRTARNTLFCNSSRHCHSSFN